jgi:hypothetical protein
MTSSFDNVVRSRWLAGCTHAGLWVLLYLTAASLGGRFPIYHEGESTAPLAGNIAPVEKLEALSDKTAYQQVTVGTNSLNPFTTRHFIPPPAQPPPAPTTRKINLTYLGFYEFEGATSKRQIIVKLGDAFLVRPLGSNLTANLFGSAVTVQTLTLTNTAAQTNILQLNTQKELEVPIQ